MPRPKPVLITIAVSFLLTVAVASNVQKYLTDGSTLEIPLAGAVTFGTLATLFARPRGVADIGYPIAALLAVVLLSIKHEWSGNSAFDIARAVLVVAFASSCFFIGACLQQNSKSKQQGLLQLIAVALLVVVIIASIGILRTLKNVMGGTAFELIMFASIMTFARRRALRPWHGFVTAAVIVASALLVNHRAMVGIGLAFGLALEMFSHYRRPWLRVVPILTATIVAIGAIVALTALAQSEQMAHLDTLVLQETGRHLNSGRETFWGILVQGILDGPLLGHGPTAIAFDLTGLNLSTHNAFLQVGLSFGPVGLLTVVVILLMLAKRAVTAPVTRAGAFLSAALGAIMIHNSSENALFQNAFGIAAISWVNLGFLASACNVSEDISGQRFLMKSRVLIRTETSRFSLRRSKHRFNRSAGRLP